MRPSCSCDHNHLNNPTEAQYEGWLIGQVVAMRKMFEDYHMDDDDGRCSLPIDQLTNKPLPQVS